MLFRDHAPVWTRGQWFATRRRDYAHHDTDRNGEDAARRGESTLAACRLARRALQLVLDLLQEPRQFHGLGVEIVATRRQRPFAILDERIGGQGDDRDRTRRRRGLVRAQLLRRQNDDGHV